MSLFQKLKSIFSGWWNYFFKSEKIEQMASRRARICAACPYLKPMFTDILWDENNPAIAGKECSLCGCPAPAKVRSPEESCPDFRWEAEKI